MAETSTKETQPSTEQPSTEQPSTERPSSRKTSRTERARSAARVRGDRDTPVRARSLRAHNLALVLRQVGSSQTGQAGPGGPGAVSRADIAAATGLTKATVSTLVDELLAGSLLEEVEPARRTGAGRPAVGLRLSALGPAGLGLEVSVDYLAASVVDLTGATRYHEVHPAQLRGMAPGEVLDELASVGAKAAGAAEEMGVRVAGAAVAVPGLVSAGVVRAAPNLDWHDVEVPVALAGRLDAAGVSLPATALSVDNEANFAALAELSAWAEAEPAAERASFVYVSGEIGVGSGIVLEGRLFRGARGFGGELGHVSIRPDGPRCHCGARGCLEAYANQESLLRNATIEAEPPSAVQRLAAQASAGSHWALMALEEAGTAIGVAAAVAVNLLDVQTVVLGGIYATLAPWLVEPVSREIGERVLTARWSPVSVRPSLLGPAATVAGAAGSVVRAIREFPAAWLETGPA